METSSAKHRGAVMIRKVWGYNLTGEFNLIHSILKQDFRHATFDTEFPGTVYPQTAIHDSPAYLYASLKLNVDATNLIQLGLTLSNSKGDLPKVDGTPIVWEFNFKDFDLARGDLHNSASIKLLKQQGIDFEKNAMFGIDSRIFADFLVNSGLVFNSNSKNPVTWIGFHTGYDFGYLVRILTQAELPEQLLDFMAMVKTYFGTRIYDVKYMMKFCNGLYGGLDNVAKLLGVKRRAGKCHQAGSDSLLTMESFMKMKECFRGNMWSEDDMHSAYGGVLFGLEVVPQFADYGGFYQQNAPVFYRQIGGEPLATIYGVA